MENISYDRAYKEVLIIIKNLVEDDYKKIPKEYIKFFEDNCNDKYEFEYDQSKTLEEQNLSDYSKLILFGLFEKFGATEMQKKKISEYKKNYYINQEIKKENVEYEGLFKTKENLNTSYIEDKKENNDNIQLIEYHNDSIIKRIINFLKNIVKKI